MDLGERSEEQYRPNYVERGKGKFRYFSCRIEEAEFNFVEYDLSGIKEAEMCRAETDITASIYPLATRQFRRRFFPASVDVLYGVSDFLEAGMQRL